MDVARVNTHRSGQCETPMHMAWFTPHRPVAVAQFRGGGGLEVGLFPGDDSTRPGLKRALELGMTSGKIEKRDRLCRPFGTEYGSGRHHNHRLEASAFSVPSC